MDSTSRVNRRELLLAGGSATALLAMGGVGALGAKALAAPLGPSDVFNASAADLGEITRRLSTVYPAHVVLEPRVGRGMVRWYDDDLVIGTMTFGPVVDGNTLVVGTLSYKQQYRDRGIMSAALEESQDWLLDRGIRQLRAPVTLEESREIFVHRGFSGTSEGDVLEYSLT
jgi:hypothetical protein